MNLFTGMLYIIWELLFWTQPKSRASHFKIYERNCKFDRFGQSIICDLILNDLQSSFIKSKVKRIPSKFEF